MKEVFLNFCRIDASKECRNWIEIFWDQLRKDSKLARCCMDSSKFAEKKGIMRISKGRQHTMNHNVTSIYKKMICGRSAITTIANAIIAWRDPIYRRRNENAGSVSLRGSPLFSLCIYFSLCAIVLRRCAKGNGNCTIIQWERILKLLGLYWLYHIAFGNQGKRARYMISWREREQLIEMVL